SAEFAATVADVREAELDARPLPDEWTVREICHHLADSELTSAVRLRRLVAEDAPLIQGYDEEAFVRRLHVGRRPIASSIAEAAAPHMTPPLAPTGGPRAAHHAALPPRTAGRPTL